jgi:hypothetical protein
MNRKQKTRTMARHRRDARFYNMGFWFCIQEIRELPLRKKLKVLFMILKKRNSIKSVNKVRNILKH